MTTVKASTVGSSTGIVLRREVLAKLRVRRGDTLCVRETLSSVELTPYDPKFAAQMEAAEDVMRGGHDAAAGGVADSRRPPGCGTTWSWPSTGA